MNKISVIVAAYNVANEINKCLNSLHTQNMKDAEFLIIDDGSTDNTAIIIKNFIDKTKDNRFKYLHKANGGLSDAQNYGLKYATGQYIWFVDGDDSIKNTVSLDELYNYANNHSLEILEFNYFTRENKTAFDRSNNFDLSGVELLNQGISSHYAYGAYVWHYLYNNNFLKQVSASFKKGIYMEDELFMIPLLLKAKHVGYLNQAYYYYYYRSDSITENKNIQHRIKLAQDHLYVVNAINDYVKSTAINSKYLCRINRTIARTYLFNALKLIGYDQTISKRNAILFLKNKSLNPESLFMKMVLLNMPSFIRTVFCKVLIKVYP